MLHASGVPVILSAGGWDQMRADFVKKRDSGIVWSARAAALAALTSVPAATLGLEKELGMIKPGQPSNLGLYSADPFELSSTSMPFGSEVIGSP